VSNREEVLGIGQSSLFFEGAFKGSKKMDYLRADFRVGWGGGKRPSEWVPYTRGESVGVLLHTKVVNKDLGMNRMKDLKRQLEVDLPRSTVLVEGVGRALHPSHVLRSASYPKFCTQACLAPAVEWLLVSGFIAKDDTREGMVARVQKDGSVEVKKPLSLLDGRTFLSSRVCVTVSEGEGLTLISVDPFIADAGGSPPRDFAIQESHLPIFDEVDSNGRGEYVWVDSG